MSFTTSCQHVAGTPVSHRSLAKRAASLAGAGLMALGIAVIAWTAGDYGVAWDDFVQNRYGELVLHYFLTGSQDRSCNDWLDLKVYAPQFELTAAIVARFAPHRLIEVRHVLCGITALLIVPPLLGFGRLLGRPWVGLIAAISVFLLPVFYGHAMVNSKDIPFAVGFAWSMYTLTAMFAKGKFTWRDMFACGLAVGATVSIRPGGWMLLLPLYAAFAIWFDWRARRMGRPIQRTLLKQACLVFVAWAVMVSVWPWAHENPWLHPLQAVRAASQFPTVVPVLFAGQFIPSNELPRHYLLSQLLLTTPLVVLLLALVGLAAGAHRCLPRLNHPRTIVFVSLTLWLALPLALFVVMRPNAYDGLRHFLFLLPAVALWCGCGCQWLWARWPTPAPRAVLAVVLASAATCQIQTLVRLHPYQMTYFNCLAGGVAGAAERYDTDGWLTSYKEAIEWIKSQPTTASGEPIRVLVAANENSRWCADYFAGDQLEITTTLSACSKGDLPLGIDYYVGTSRWALHRNFPEAPVAYQVAREGAVFTTVKRPARLEHLAADK